MDALLVCCTGLTGTSGVPSTKAADPNIFKGSGSYQPRSFCVPRRLLPQSHPVPGSRGVVDRPPIDGRLAIADRTRTDVRDKHVVAGERQRFGC